MFPVFQTQLMNYRPVTSIVRMMLGVSIFATVFYDKGFYRDLCGILAIPANPKYLLNIIIIEAVASHYPILTKLLKHNYRLESLAQNYFIKNLMILMLKVGIILGQTHRLKFYIHTLMIEGTILIITFLFDLTGNQNICEVWDIVINGSFHRIALFYEITRTFCPNFAIYWFITCLIQLCFSQIQSHWSIEKNNLKNDPLYPSSLYVKQDVHRLMILGLVYLGLFGYLQIHLYGYGMMITYIVGFYPFYRAVEAFEQNRIGESILMLTVVSFSICGLIYFRIEFPELFKPLGKEDQDFSCLYYEFLLHEI